jgi:hypothetical protein
VVAVQDEGAGIVVVGHGVGRVLVLIEGLKRLDEMGESYWTGFAFLDWRLTSTLCCS